MTEEALRSVKVSGSGTVAGGRYDRVKGSGSVRIDGDVVAHSIETSGSMKGHGNLRVEWLRSSGSAAVEGDVSTVRGHASGSWRVSGNVRIDEEAKISGSAHVDGSLAGEAVVGSGSLRVRGDIALESLVWSGAINCPGLVSADTVDIRLGGACQLGELAGSSISVRAGMNASPWLAWLNFSRTQRLTVGEISGDDIRLEHTEARVVRGDRVSIGSHCRVDRVEYRKDFTVHSDAWVGESVRVEGNGQ